MLQPLRRLSFCTLLFSVFLCLPAPCSESFEPESILPPRLEWNGTSRRLMLAADDPLATPFERSGGLDTATRAETEAWLLRLASMSPKLKLVTIGHSSENKPIRMAIASREGAADAASLVKNTRPTLLIQAGIHAGEIDGKDAGLMFLRDLLRNPEKQRLLDTVNLLFIPILNPDGHDHSSRFHRINQRGPRELGWRTNGKNLNLNRDYTKLDTREIRAVVQVIRDFDPELYLDIHVTDGMDYQYDITFGHMGAHGHSPNLSNWMASRFTPKATKALSEAGHLPGPLLFALNGQEPSGGLIDWVTTPRFSNVYGDARHLATLLVENHSLKPFEQRVLGTYVLIEAAAQALAEGHESLIQARELDKKRQNPRLPYGWSAPTEKEKLEFAAVGARQLQSEVSGGNYWTFDGTRTKLTVPYLVLNDKPKYLDRPKGYWIPPAWSELLELLSLHGIQTSPAPLAGDKNLEQLRFGAPKWEAQPFEGRFRLTASYEVEPAATPLEPGWVYLDASQPLGELAVLLLEPDSPDSFFQWGFFAPIFQRTEYFETYAGEPLAAKMWEDPAIRQAFEAKKAAEPEFAKDQQAVLEWFFDRSPYRDRRWRLYPILRQR